MVTGGVETEVQYLNVISEKIRGTGVSIHIAKSGNDPKTLISEAVNKLREDRRKARDAGDAANVFDAVWVVCDVDDFRTNIVSARNDARNAKVSMAISNPCFELWLIWHQTDHASHQTQKVVQKAAAKLGVTAGAKGKDICREKIEGKYEGAKARAISAAQLHVRNEVSFPDDNPSSNIYELIDFILASTAGMPGSKLVSL